MKRGILILIAALVIRGQAAAATPVAELVTTSSAGAASVSAGGDSFGPRISGDGTRVAFVSHAGNLVTNQTSLESLQVFVRNLMASNTTLVTVSTNGDGGNGNSFGPVVSSNGQFVAFTSDATDLTDGDTNSFKDIYVRDLASGTTHLVSADLSGHAPLSGSSGNPLMSTDARWVFFDSSAQNLTSETSNEWAAIPTTDVFARDLQSNVTVLVTRNSLGNRAANASSTLQSITSDGRRVAFVSSASDLRNSGSTSLADVYVRDMPTRTLYQASSGLNYTNGYRCEKAALSEDGRFIVFTLLPVNGVRAVYLRDLEAQSPILVTTNVLERSAPQISADGRYVVFENGTNVFRFDATTGVSELVNVTTMGAPPLSGIARNPVATPDGNGITFISNCPDLVTNASLQSQIYARDMAAGTTRCVTIATNAQPSATDHQTALIAVAPDFSHVAFDSTGDDLVTADGNRASDVFVRDLGTETTSLISQRVPSRVRNSGVASAFVGSDCVSADGRFVTFTSFDNDLLPGDANAKPDVFVRDLLTGTVVTPGFSNNAACSPAISGDGRYVVYLRRKPSQVLEISGDIYRFDRETGTNELVAQTTGMSAITSSAAPVISSNGNYIAFLSNSNLVVRDMIRKTNVTIDAAIKLKRDAAFTPDGRFLLFNRRVFLQGVYAWDTLLQKTQWVSYANSSFALCLSGNSRFVAAASFSEIVLHDLIGGTNQVFWWGPFASRPMVALNHDATLFVFARTQSRLTALNRITGEESIIVDGGGDLIDAPSVSADGRFVIYSRRVAVTNGVDSTFVWQLYVRDRTLGTTTLISTGDEGANANANVSRAVLAGDGRTLVFHSVASDLVAGDYNDKSDVFVLKLGGADTDGDSIDDDWETAYFDNLSRNGTGDFDEDGASDRAEFLAGTDPTNNDSIFRVLTVAPLSGGSTRIIWNGDPARTYRVEFKDDLGTPAWSALTGTVSWNGSTASITDSNVASAHRYYRVVGLP